MHWRVPSARNVLVSDGEMSRRLVKQRLMDGIRTHLPETANFLHAIGLHIASGTDFLVVRRGRGHPNAVQPLVGVYLLMARGRIVYVGSSLNMPARVAQHPANSRGGPRPEPPRPACKGSGRGMGKTRS